MRSALFQKYDLAVPRYTSYPAVPNWDHEVPAEKTWLRAVEDAWITGGRKLSLYIHLPFCESLCTYCACNTRITKNHSVEEPYILNLLREWSIYLDVFAEMPRIEEMHLGGGTPTFFSPEHLSSLIKAIRETSVIPANAAMSFEAHPANTTSAHLEKLFLVGFRRLSLGVQDFNPVVQRLINRRQSETQVKAIADLSRIIGYTSVNFDLIYGLPAQTPESISETVKKVIDIHPDRIAFYSYAHVPWMKPGQRAYTDADLPTGAEKRKLYETGREILERAGYVEIGLDHFALPGDELLNAAITKKLHRNFMGYTEKETSLLIGLGVSAISDAGTMLMQSKKTTEEWEEDISLGKLSVMRGHQLSAEDLVMRRQILNIMCKGETSWMNEREERKEAFEIATQRLSLLVNDGLVELKSFSLRVTEKGKPFLRNIASCFDMRMLRESTNGQKFSTTA